jgi:NADP-dependent aldehyde dehydrogenase
MTATIPSDTDLDDLAAITAAAAAAAPTFGALAPATRAMMLDAVADAIDAESENLVPIAAAESHLPNARLVGEVARTTYQLRSFSNLLREGLYLEAIIETAKSGSPLGPMPDLRRMLVPVGPVAVFSASNFPFAFSVPGGDTASALAAGCPVVVKAHPAHPQLSVRVTQVVNDALRTAGAPDGVFALVHGVETGVQLLKDEHIAAGAFTGSIPGGRALFDVANARPVPIPFYAEMGSLNPVFVTRAAVQARGEAIAREFVGSFTLGVGQFCTKPGVLFLPAGHGLDRTLVEAASAVVGAPMLTPGIADRFSHLVSELDNRSGVSRLVTGTASDGGWSPSLFRTDTKTLRRDPEPLLEERFGPASLIVEYDDEVEFDALARLFAGNLTATLHGEESDLGSLLPLVNEVAARSGRVLWNGWPTGVTVSPAMHHGGPYPATAASLHTSVGTTAIRRFLRPVCYQSMPTALLPPALRDQNEMRILRWVDGRLTAGTIDG